MKKLIFATNNQHKVDEMRVALNNLFEIITLKEAGIDIEIEEPYQTLEENALEKSSVIYKMTGQNCFSEDTGLEIDALNGAPGVKSARYSGDDHDFNANVKLVLKNLKDTNYRDARFRTIISLILNGKQHFFEGICEGKIADKEHGTSGFGYDPIFIPAGSDITFAEMDISGKNKFSHRKKAVDKLIKFLQVIT